MRTAKAGSRTVLALTLLTTAGCYTYVPMDPPRVGAPVRLDVPVTSSVGGSAREPELVTFEGVIVGLGDTLLLETRAGQAVGTHGQFTMKDTIRVRSSSVSALEERVFSKPRTAAFSAVLLGGVVLAFTAIESVTGGGEGEKPGNGSPTQGAEIHRTTTGWRLIGIRIPMPWPSG